MANPVITVRNFSYRYKGTSTQALDNLSFVVEQNELCGILGSSEAGKTTLCYAIASVLPHYFRGGIAEGSLMVRDVNAMTAPLELMVKNVGIFLQNSGVYLTGVKPTVKEEIAFSMENFGIERARISERVDFLMEEMGISHLASRNPLTLSGGETQRVALASVLALDPPILILDEPTASLDPEGVRDLRAILEKLKGKKTILLVDQKFEIMPGLVDRILVLDGGKLTYQGTPEGFFTSARSLDESIGIPLWTEVVYQLGEMKGKKIERLPYTYRQSLIDLRDLQ